MEEKHEFKAGDTVYVDPVIFQSTFDFFPAIRASRVEECLEGGYTVRNDEGGMSVELPNLIHSTPFPVLEGLRNRAEKEIKTVNKFLKRLDEVEKKYREENSEYYQPGLFEKEE